MWLQREIILDAKERGFHIVTNEIVSKLSEIDDIILKIKLCESKNEIQDCSKRAGHFPGE